MATHNSLKSHILSKVTFYCGNHGYMRYDVTGTLWVNVRKLVFNQRKNSKPQQLCSNECSIAVRHTIIQIPLRVLTSCDDYYRWSQANFSYSVQREYTFSLMMFAVVRGSSHTLVN